MGKVLVRKADGLTLSYDKNLARDPRFETVEDPEYSTATIKAKDAFDLEARSNLALQDADGKSAADRELEADDDENLGRVSAILDALGVTDIFDSVADGLDLALNKLLNPVAIADLVEIPEVELKPEDIPEAPQEEEEAPAPEELDDVDGLLPEEELPFEAMTDKAELKKWAKDTIDLTIKGNKGVERIKKEIRAAIAG